MFEHEQNLYLPCTMEEIGLQYRTSLYYYKVTMCRGKTNFFEKRVGDYQKAGVMNSLSGDGHSIAFDADF